MMSHSNSRECIQLFCHLSIINFAAKKHFDFEVHFEEVISQSHAQSFMSLKIRLYFFVDVSGIENKNNNDQT